MKKYIPILALCLSACLFIYVFYRTEKTLVNYIATALLSKEGYKGVKEIIISVLPLKDVIIYSLPEGLWVFCITITSSFFYIKMQNRKLSLTLIPLLLAILMEVSQLLQFTNGRFDFMDILFSAVFWLLALCCTKSVSAREPVFRSFDARTAFCVGCYSIVYLAHVAY